jgi:hypothetical protein
MAMELPPSRYRVIERGRRLEVIDTLAGRRPAYAAEAQPQPWAPNEMADRQPADQPEMSPEPVAVEKSVPAAPPTAPVGSMPETPPDFLMNAASIAGSERDRDGRLLLNTARWYDAKGPRTIALSQAAERELGGVVLAALVIAVGGIVFGVLIGWVGVAALVIAASFGGRIKSIATPWLDRLAARSR